MARSRLQRCTSCGAYGLSTTCSRCGAPAQAAAPLRYSPEDPQSERRRQFQKVTDAEWAQSLPITTPKGSKTVAEVAAESEEEE